MKRSEGGLTYPNTARRTEGEYTMVKVCIQRATYSEPEIERLLAPLGGMANFVEKGEEGPPEGESFVCEGASKGGHDTP